MDAHLTINIKLLNKIILQKIILTKALDGDGGLRRLSSEAVVAAGGCRRRGEYIKVQSNTQSQEMTIWALIYPQISLCELMDKNGHLQYYMCPYPSICERSEPTYGYG